MNDADGLPIVARPLAREKIQLDIRCHQRLRVNGLSGRKPPKQDMDEQFSRLEELRSRLEESEVKQRLAEHAEAVRSAISKGQDLPFRHYISVDPFNELIVQRLTEPHVVTPQDLVDAFLHHLVPGSVDSFDLRFRRFVLFAASDVGERCSPPFEVLTYPCTSFFDLSTLADEPVIWQSERDYFLSFNGVLKQKQPFDPALLHESELHEHAVYFSLAGYCSERALTLNANRIKDALHAFLYSYQLLAEHRESDVYDKLNEEIEAMFTDDSPVVNPSSIQADTESFDEPCHRGT